MLAGLILYALLLPWSLQSELQDLLSTADQFFGELIYRDNTEADVEAIKLLLRRTYNLEEGGEHGIIHKRSLDYNEPLFRDTEGFFSLSNIQDVTKIPAKFPDDINILSSHNLIYVTALEANGSDPENQLANDLVLYQYSSIQGFKEMGRVSVIGGTRLAVLSFHNVTYIMASEHDADTSPEGFQGSALYKMEEGPGTIFLDRLQVLNVKHPNDVKLWEHQDQLYLALGTNQNETGGASTLIFRWMGLHFDCIQEIPSKEVQGVLLFSIGSFMYLAVANFQDEFGNVDIDSEIYKFHLQEMKFKSIQRIRTHGARDWAYFKFENTKHKKSEHFIVVANSMTRHSGGSLTSLTQSVVYKFSNSRFLPFQSFKLYGATQWLPVQGSNGEFLLLVSHSYGVVGYQYDGWRFTEVNLKFDQSPFGESLRSIRAFQYLGNIYLTVADKTNYGNNVNLWKLSFTKRNDLEKQYKEIETWCDDMISKMEKDGFDELMNEYMYILEGDEGDEIKKEEKRLEEEKETQEDDEEEEEREDEERNRGEEENSERLEVLNQKLGDVDKELSEELERLSSQALVLENMLTTVEKQMEEFKSKSEIPIIIGSKKLPYLEVNCNTSNCCIFKNVKILNLNGVNLPEFLSNTISLNEDITESMLKFEHLVVEDDLSTILLNGHPTETLVDTSSDTFINAHIIVNGTVFINQDLNVMGLFDGVIPDESHMLLNGRDQVFDEKLCVESLTVDDFKMSGILNGMPVEDLFLEPTVELKNEFKELNVNNLFLEGLVNGYNLTELFDEMEDSEDQTIDGNLDLVCLEAEEVLVDSDKISNISLADVLDSYNEALCDADYVLSPRDNTEKPDGAVALEEDSHTTNESEEENIIIVEGILKAKDISDPDNSTSLWDIMTNAYKLNETVIDSTFVFSDISVEALKVEVVNDVPVESWVLVNSTEVQHIYGKKKFLDNVHIRKEVSVDEMNSVKLEELEEDILKLDQDQDISGDWFFDTVTCHELITNHTNIRQMTLESVERLEINGSVTLDKLVVENLNLNGEIDGVSWADMLEDSVLDKNDVVTGEIEVDGSIRVKNLNLAGKINDLLFDEFFELNTKEAEKIILNRNVTLENPLFVEELEFEGLLDFVLTPNFHREWLLCEEPQIITAPMTFEDIDLKSGSSLMNETINNTNLRKIFAKSLKINEDTKIRNLYLVDKVRAERIDVGGTVNGADFNESVVQKESDAPQIMSGDWFFNQGLIINGSLIVNGHVSGLNMSHLCALNVSADKINLIVRGSVNLQQEPHIKHKVNGINLTKVIDETWMKNENTTLSGGNLRFGDVELDGETTLTGYLNDVNLTHVSKFYLSKSLNRVVSADYVLDEVVIDKYCRTHTATVGGTVNGLNLTHWAKNVLLQDEDQVVEEKLRFEIFQTTELKLNGTVNGMNLSRDVLRYDQSNAFVEGEKTFHVVNVVNLTITKGKTIQGVDVDYWRENILRKNENCVIKGNLTLINPEFRGDVSILGRINEIYFNSSHLLTTTGNQVVTGIKHFDLSDTPDDAIQIKSLQVSGPVGGVNISNLLENQAYSHRNLLFKKPQAFTKGFSVDQIELDGLLNDLNLTEICEDLSHPVDVGYMKEEFDDLLNLTKTLKKVVEGRAFFFDYLELIQTLKPNIRAVVPTLNSKNNHMLAVLTPTTMNFKEWNTFSETFVDTGEGLRLNDNITFITSEITNGNSLLYIERAKSSKIFRSGHIREIKAVDTSCVASFELKALNKSCIFIGQKWNSSRILCESSLLNDLQTYQWLESRGSVQVTVLTVGDEVYIAVINKEEVVDKIENTLSIYRFDRKLQHFHVTHTLAEVNPVAVSSVTYRNEHYLVSAGGHLPESVHNSVLSIFRFNKQHRVFVRDQSILVDTPVDVHFALLPSPQLALYVLTSNPTKPFVMFLHKGVSGFIEETSGLSLYPGSNIYSFTDSQYGHFVVISGFGKGQILKAGFKGDRVTTT